MSTPHTLIKSATSPSGRLQQQPTKPPVKVVRSRPSTDGSHNSGGQSRDGWVQQDEQS
jgi:hypothetical protein